MNWQLRNSAGLPNKHFFLFGRHMSLRNGFVKLGEEEDEAAQVRAAWPRTEPP
jgi:hypothetical protein